MAFDGRILLDLLSRIGNNNKAGEYYLTDAVEIARAGGHRVAFELIAEDEVHGVNTRAQLAAGRSHPAKPPARPRHGGRRHADRARNRDLQPTTPSSARMC